MLAHYIQHQRLYGAEHGSEIIVSWLRSCLGTTAGHKDVDLRWQALEFQAIEEAGVVADVDGKAQKNIAKACTRRMEASDISELLLGRNDHALFVSMWACLFLEVERRCKQDRERFIELLSSPLAAEVLDGFIEKHKIPPCPEVFAKALLCK